MQPSVNAQTIASQAPLRVVHADVSLQAGIGGPTVCISSYGQAMARLGWDIRMCSVNWWGAFGREMVPLDRSLVQVHTVRGLVWPWPRMWLTPGFPRVLRRAAVGADVMHLHGFWLSLDNSARKVARKMGIPYVISVHGQLDPPALRISGWKKAIARHLYADRNLHHAACLHATAMQELQAIRAYGLTRPVAVIPHGIDPKPFDSLPSSEQAGRRWRELAGKKLILSLGRIHPKKGLDLLVEAWCHLAKQFEDWHLVIAGPDEVGLQARLEEMLRRRGATERATFTGPVYGSEKLELLAACELFVLPSLTENFAMTVVEALAARKPVIATVTTPWEDLRTYRCGWTTEVGVEPLQAVLTEALAVDRQQRIEMGLRGRKLVEEKYSLDQVIGKMAEMYHWLVDGGSPPDCVVLDGKGSHAD